LSQIAEKLGDDMDKDASLQKQIHNNFNKLVEKAIHIQEITHFNQKRLKDMKV
jgi:hypothetical protein